MPNSINIKIKLLGENPLLLPGYQTNGSAGADLRANLSCPLVIEPMETKLVPTGISIALPNNSCAAMVYPRSGLSLKHGITMVNSVGVIDSDYRGEICCPMINLSKESYTVEPMERIAQLVITPVCVADFEVTNELDETKRSEGGFGSTGKL